MLGVAIPDVPGGLNKVLQVLTDARINVEYMYAFLGGKTEAAYMIFRVEDNNAAAEAWPPGASRPWRKRISSECKAKQLSRKKGQTARQPARGLLFQIRS